MTKRLSPVFAELAQDALLRAFWHKRSLHSFLQQHGVAGAVLAQWHPDQTKREYAEWLWSHLIQSDQGHRTILAIARSLAEMRDFPDLERREDTKEQIAGAKLAVDRLKIEVTKIDRSTQETASAKERRKANQQELESRLAEQKSVGLLLQELEGLMPQLGTQAGGYAFEKWFYDLANFFELSARPSYKVGARQIDGAITIEGTTYLIETKFTANPVGSPDVDIFMAKIESKADNTMGLFVSTSGFNSGAVAAASKPKTPMLLLDHSHLFGLILRGVMSLPDVVSRVKRHASQTGSAYLSAKDF
jgi:hypothetical protein